MGYERRVVEFAVECVTCLDPLEGLAVASACSACGSRRFGFRRDKYTVDGRQVNGECGCPNCLWSYQAKAILPADG